MGMNAVGNSRNYSYMRIGQFDSSTIDVVPNLKLKVIHRMV